MAKFLLTAFFISIDFVSFGQIRNKRTLAYVTEASVDWDSTITISKKEFESILLKCTGLFYHNSVEKFSASEHSLILRLLNTALMAPLRDTAIFQSKEYVEFRSVVDSARYADKLLALFPNYFISRGMSFYFPELRVEYLGTPHLRSYFDIEN